MKGSRKPTSQQHQLSPTEKLKQELAKSEEVVYGIKTKPREAEPSMNDIFTWDNKEREIWNYRVSKKQLLQDGIANKLKYKMNRSNNPWTTEKMDQYRNFSYDQDQKTAFYQFDEEELAVYEEEEREKKQHAAKQKERRIGKRNLPSAHSIKTHYTSENQKQYGAERLKSAKDKNRKSRNELQESKAGRQEKPVQKDEWSESPEKHASHEEEVLLNPREKVEAKKVKYDKPPFKVSRSPDNRRYAEAKENLPPRPKTGGSKRDVVSVSQKIGKDTKEIRRQNPTYDHYQQAVEYPQKDQDDLEDDEPRFANIEADEPEAARSNKNLAPNINFSNNQKPQSRSSKNQPDELMTFNPGSNQKNKFSAPSPSKVLNQPENSAFQGAKRITPSANKYNQPQERQIVFHYP